MRPKHQDLPPDASDEELFNNQIATDSEDNDTGEWISGGASSMMNQAKSSGRVGSNNFQRMMIAPQSNSSGFNRQEP